MKIRNSKSFFLFYAAIGYLLAAFVLVVGLYDFASIRDIWYVWVLFTLVFLGMGVYLTRKALDRSVIFEFDSKGIHLHKTGDFYAFADLKFYRYQRIRSKGTAAEIIYFYNPDQIRVFKIQFTGTDWRKEECFKLLNNKLRRLQR